MRAIMTIAFVLAVPTMVSALPRVSVDVEPSATAVQNRFLPGFLGGGGDRKEGGNAAMRIEQLEAQVRMLTGQVEQLTFSVRRLEAALERMQAGDQRGALAGSGAPARPLGTTQPSSPSVPPATGGTATAGASSGAAPAGSSGGLSGPIDLSVLNNGAGSSGGFQSGAAVPPPASTGSATASPSGADPALDNVRQLQSSGRYQMAADEARAVLAGNPSGAVAGEARYLLGEALMAQGDYRGAANQFLENYTSDPNNPLAPVSLLKLGTALNGLGEREAACSSLDELFGAYPNVDGDIRAAAERERRAANCA